MYVYNSIHAFCFYVISFDLYMSTGTELGFEVEGGKYNFLEWGKYNFPWTYFLKS